MQAEFNEKAYENYFNDELNRYASFYYPIGQVEEGKLGFDCYAYIDEYKELWSILNKPFSDGVEFRKIANKMEENISNMVNDFRYELKLNLLFQYKRPEYLISNKYKEWKNWRKPCFRYIIQHKQQHLLMKINKYFGDNVLIIYAAPAFYTNKELFIAKNEEQIIFLSNFCEASTLDGHAKNTYVKEGTHSIACSKPKTIANFDLKNAIDSKSYTEITMDDKLRKKNKDFIIKFGKGFFSVIKENRYFSQLSTHLLQYQYLAKYELLYSHIVLNEIRKSTGLQWLII